MISIVIPTYLQPKAGGEMLIQLLNSIRLQSVSVPYEIIISDNDDTDKIFKICERFWMLPIKYHHNLKKGASENFNFAIDLASYNKIKLMCMDDLFYNKAAIDIFSDALDKHNWVISNSVHVNEHNVVYGRRYTQYNHNQMEQNLTGMPSVVGFHKCDIRFDTNLKTFCDTYFYYQLYEKYGAPGIIQAFTVACRFWSGSLSHNQPSHKKQDLEYLRQNRMIRC